MIARRLVHERPPPARCLGRVLAARREPVAELQEAAAGLAARALPARPWLAGAIYGLGAGLIADSGTRLFCWVSEPAHVLVAHGGSILSLAVLGGLTAAVIERTRARTLWPK